ncbi:MAG: pyridoxal-phosphate dependent enzyme [Candidatus Rokubacteria bacterium]|nr:pyridoxal-phosphate dependent enzyme [Candidatus Rokubacteria bacterium]MBI3825991.1 pyridoxal-phosphate dependent enzyme [Candidatus Rokubacteria bacterium]
MSAPASLARELACTGCGATYPLTYRLECAACRGLLELRYDLETLRCRGPALLEGRGLWRYASVLPVADPAHRVSLGEGDTPLLDCPRLARDLGVQSLAIKFEGANPTGTVKDRSSATAIGAALQFGFRAISVVSTGNAGSSIAAYAARAGLRSFIFAYERASAPKVLHMAATASDFVVYSGGYDDLIGPWDRLAGEGLFFDGGASRNAYKHEGKKTLAYEIAEQSGWTPPDVVVAPVAVGETFIAAARGFREMETAGWIARRPRMIAAQATRANPVSRAFREGGPVAPVTIGYTVAEGLAAGNPGRKGEWVLRLLREDKGLAGDAEDEAILAAQRRLARTEGIWAGPTGVATLAVLAGMLERREVDPGQRFCVVVTETGLKTEAALPARGGTAFDDASLRRLVEERLRR